MHRLVKILYASAIALCFMLLSTEESKAQRLAVSTNMLELALLSPNLTLDFSLAQHHSVSVSASASPWRYSSETYLNHFTWSPEYKYWFTMPFYKNYVGAKLFYSSYDLGMECDSFKGNLVALLVDYGYSVILSKRWNITPCVGIGAGYNVSEVSKVVPMISLGVNAQIVLK